MPVGLLRGHLPERVRPAAGPRKVLKPVLEILAGIPTVVYGFFALTFVTPLLQDIWFCPAIPPGLQRACRPAWSWAS